MCDVMPTISEDNLSQRAGQFIPAGVGDEATLEQLMVGMLDERDKLVENLKDSEATINDTNRKLSEVEKERDAMSRQLQSRLPQVSFCCKSCMLPNI